MKRTNALVSDFGRDLPSFKSTAEARSALFKIRGQLVGKLVTAIRLSDAVDLDFSIDSLKVIEPLYNRWKKNPSKLKKLGFTRFELQLAVAFYFGTVVVRRGKDTHWLVQPYEINSDKYEIGVRQGKLYDLMLTQGLGVEEMPYASQQTALYRYMKATFL